MSTVLVTGGSGFIGAHAVVQLLAAGHDVHTTVRNLSRAGEVRAMLKEGGAPDSGGVRFFAADLEKDAGWREAMAGCQYVLHVASPFPLAAPKHEDELIIPAREGTLRVLRAARAAGVARVVLTSSFAAIGYGHPPRRAPFDEHDWTDLSARLPAYVKSKTLAERAAWDFVARDAGTLELSVVNPTAVFGPVLGADFSTSIGILKGMLEGALPGAPALYFGVVDVRDVAELHLRVMTHPAAAGERYLAIAGDCMSLAGIARVLKQHLGTAAARVSARQLPNWLVRLAALRDRRAREILPELGKVKNASNAKARALGWTPRPNEEAILAGARSLLRFGLIAGAAPPALNSAAAAAARGR
jgi:nucleoside-diphosphate-sugar epimerase